MAIGESLHPATYTPLRDEVLSTLRHALVSGTFAAGERIREVELAAKLGVSRGTLREALRHLEQEGLVVTNPHRGTFVVNPTYEEIKDIYGMRIALETYAVAEAAQAISTEELLELQSIVDDLNALAATGRASLAPRLGLDLRFHEVICEASGNARLVRSWTELCAPLRLLLAAFDAPYLNHDEVVGQHQQVIDALRHGDGVAARDILTQHLADSRDRMLVTLRLKRQEERDGDEPFGPLRR
jgi:DNA-binding GntR family transcriptional regulator